MNLRTKQRPRIKAFLYVSIVSALLLMSYYGWTILSAQQTTHIQSTIRSTLLAFNLQTASKLKTDVVSLERMAKRWEARGHVPKHEWLIDAQNHIEGNSSFQSIEWIGPSYKTRWIASDKKTTQLADTHFQSKEYRENLLNEAKEKNKAVFGDIIKLEQGEKGRNGFLVAIPVTIDGQSKGFIIATFQLKKFFATFLNEAFFHHSNIKIYQNKRIIFESSPHGIYDHHYTNRNVFILGHLKWTTQFTPNTHYVNSLKTAFPVTFFVVGCLISLLTAFIFYLLDISQKFAVKLQKNSTLIKESQEHLSLILSSVGEGIYGVDLSGKVTFANAATLTMLGYTEKELLGKSMHSLVHHSYPDKTPYPKEKCPIYATFGDGELHHVTNEFLWRKNGTYFPVEYTSAPIIKENHTLHGAVVVFKDVTQYRKQREIIEFNHALMDKLVMIQDDYIAGKSPHELFDEILTVFINLTGSEYGFIGEIIKDDEGISHLKSLAINNVNWAFETKNAYAKKIKKGLNFHDFNTLFGYTVKTGEKLISNAPHKNLNHDVTLLGNPKIRTYLGIPIYGKFHLIGMISLVNKKQDYDEDIVKLINPIVKSLSSIIEANIHAKKLKKLAHHDALTNLYNRAFFDKYLKETIESAGTKKTTFSIIYLDLDNFKEINDSLGHQIGDKVLQVVARRLLETSASSDVISRLGGDEFIIISKKLTSEKQANKFAENLIASVAKPFAIGASKISVTISIGMGCFPLSGQTASDLFENIDIALYKAKNSGKDQYHFSGEDVQKKQMRKLDIEYEMNQAIKKKELYIVYQPQINLLNHAFIGMEALLRWKNDTLGTVSPSEFIAILEESGPIREIGLWVIKSAFKDFNEIKDILPEDFTLSINVSYKQLAYLEFTNQIKALLDTHHIDPNKITFELTETNNTINYNAISVLNNLQDMGISIAIDDFGIGYSSLSRLKDFPIDILKIDKSFTLHLEESQETQFIIENTINLSRKLNLKCIAEGIENDEQLDFLTSHHCVYGQGFYFSKPIPLNEIKQLLKKQLGK